MKIKNIEPSLPNRDIYHLNKVWVDETLKKGIKIINVEPSITTHDCYRYDILYEVCVNQTLNKEIKLK